MVRGHGIDGLTTRVDVSKIVYRVYIILSFFVHVVGLQQVA